MVPSNVSVFTLRLYACSMLKISLCAQANTTAAAMLLLIGVRRYRRCTCVLTAVYCSKLYPR
jgi:hypothetical protein